MKKRFFTLLFALVAMVTTANAQVKINVTNFPDYNFREFVIENYGKWVQSSTYDGYYVLDPSKVASTKEMSFYYYTDSSGRYVKIESLKGIEFFTALETLDCRANQLTELDVSKNTALTTLYCDNNQLTSLDVSKNTALIDLWCVNNQLTSLDVSQNTALEWLYCYNNQLTSLDVSQNTALKTLYCDDNQLTSLDVSKNTALTSLHCNNNQLTSLDVSGCTALTELYCTDNHLSELNVSGLTSLTVLSCYKNNPLEILNASGCVSLERMSLDSGGWLDDGYVCTDGELVSLNVSGCTAIQALQCSSKLLTSLDVSGCTALTYLYISDTPLQLLDMSGCSALTSLNCGGNQLTSLDVSQNTALTKLWCPGNQLTSLDVSKNTALIDLWCSHNQLTSLDVSKNTALTNLECSDNQLTSLDVSKNTALTILNCSNNQLTTLDVSKNTALTTLYCGDNQLNSLDVSGLVNLGLFQWSGNRLTSLNTSGCIKLYDIGDFEEDDLSCLTSINVSGCIVLNDVHFFGKGNLSLSPLTSLDISGSALTTLRCSNGKLTSLKISGCSALTYVGCYGNNLTTLDLSGCSALRRLECHNNNIEGKEMDSLIISLPQKSNRQIIVIDTKSEKEKNICTKAQVSVAKEKGWTVYDNNGTGARDEYSWLNLVEYEGSDEAILLDAESFPDDNFRNAIAKGLGLTEGSEINEGLIVATTKLDVSDGKVTELSGIEHFTALTTLYCQINQISDKAMTSLIGALPDLSGNEAKGLMLTEETNPRKGALYALDFTDENEQNVCTAEHVEAANAKGWTVYCKRASGWEEYNGAKSGILLNEVFFPDANFRSELSDLFGIGEGDEVTENMIATGMLMIQKSSIADLAGIEYFTNLRTLLCGENPLTLLDVSKNTKLQRLNCKGYGQGLLASLNVSGCAILETLECDDNQLTSIDASNNPELYMLSCNNNQLSSLDLSKNTKLESLKCSNNSLTSLVVSDNASRMKILECDLNNINGETMQNLVESLPTVTNGELYVIDTSNPNENNEITKQQVSIAKEKGWTVYDKNGGSKVEYVGIDIDTPTDINSVDSGELTIDSWYTIDGKKLNGEPKEKGIYIRNGRKVVK